MKRCIILTGLLLLIWVTPTQASDFKYELFFKRWGEYYAPWEDWRWFHSQSGAESNWNPDARSAVGAIGLMQLMPATAKDLKVNPYDIEGNVQGGIHYDAWLWSKWKVVKSLDDRRSFMFASYNAGLGNIINARKKSQLSDQWEVVAQWLPQVTGKHAKETVGYVTRIKRIYDTR